MTLNERRHTNEGSSRRMSLSRGNKVDRMHWNLCIGLPAFVFHLSSFSSMMNETNNKKIFCYDELIDSKVSQVVPMKYTRLAFITLHNVCAVQRGIS